MDKPTQEQRFWAKVDRRGPEECWEWKASSYNYGYGSFWNSHRKRLERASRISYEMSHGNIPVGLIVRHKCDNPPCVNPNHLILGTMADNARDAVERGIRKSKVGEKNNSEKLSSGDVLEIRKLILGRSSGVDELSNRYNVTKSHIRNIVAKRVWKHI